MQEMPIIERAVGRKSMMEAYFHNNPQIIRSAIDELLEEGAWDDLCMASYDLLYNENCNDASGRIISKLDRLKSIEYSKKELEKHKLSCEGTKRAAEGDINVADLMKDFVDQNVTKLHHPKKGEWTAYEGNSSFILADDIEIKWGKDKHDHCTGSELKQWMLEKYGTDVVSYNHKEPDFSKFMDKSIGSICLDKMPTNRKKSYSLAEQAAMTKLGLKSKKAVKEYMKREGLTWHECADRHTVIAIPTRINAGFKHTGGISMERSVQSVGEYISHISGGRPLKIDKGSYEGMANLNEPLDLLSKKYRDIKKSRFETPNNAY